MAAPPVLDVQGLAVTYGTLEVCSDVSFSVGRGRSLALIGESGSGKSVTVLAIAGLLGGGGAIARGSVTLEGAEISRLSPKERRRARLMGRRIGMIFQNPSRALDPVYTIGQQLNEALALTGITAKADCRRKGTEWLRHVGLPDPEEALDRYPHQLSGGQRQRAMIAIALASEPEILIADEPTTALDVTIQAQVLNLIRRLQRELNLALVLVTHDFGVVAAMADDVAVMYAGQVVEVGAVADIIRRPVHPYTRALLSSLPTGKPGGRIEALAGSVPTAVDMPSGCRFHPRCGIAEGKCSVTAPRLEPSTYGRLLRCLNAEELRAHAI
ncbi:ATP-binding cassette domain-containing protein (plasmid) [Ponticoccus alexandrii]|uniref:ATP-binding cassette domain-containing protein n=2 Tax=Ponticoccus alexandrii TaxID=1943633 RepID=A0ABX7FHT7_9RHOB|nr:peptide ABC transporter ATP-binding protein [Rhodobacteraceae bacterium PD-2]QRF68952.1 ATP-binding cassette domain-containing protein [Ponticoccus alexandrii]